jgi:hypothetical protein
VRDLGEPLPGEVEYVKPPDAGVVLVGPEHEALGRVDRMHPYRRVVGDVVLPVDGLRLEPRTHLRHSGRWRHIGLVRVSHVGAAGVRGKIRLTIAVVVCTVAACGDRFPTRLQHQLGSIHPLPAVVRRIGGRAAA